MPTSDGEAVSMTEQAHSSSSNIHEVSSSYVGSHSVYSSPDGRYAVKYMAFVIGSRVGIKPRKERKRIKQPG